MVVVPPQTASDARASKVSTVRAPARDHLLDMAVGIDAARQRQQAGGIDGLGAAVEVWRDAAIRPSAIPIDASCWPVSLTMRALRMTMSKLWVSGVSSSLSQRL